MNIKTKINIGVALGTVSTLLFPFTTFAVTQVMPFQNVQDIVLSIGRIVGYLMPIAFALAIVAFFWGVAKYIFSAGEEESQAAGKRIMIGGVIGIAVISLIWGLVMWLAAAFGIDQNTYSRQQPGFTSNQPVINP